ncbi:Xaa-Pro dipeptidyl-peptidase [Holzapfeliella floricola]|uniref:Xaa-Pro dipeptidyl-peptidase n=1 Tax=Holzapfeliella floricola DSM 23037 = JCM 16512 TaxID=1423744 RepID=A0A0R2DUU4_9LACO|nr:Xaa-Pro dipeptidyl-peptidase [Holzapfeliella floricola]KRN03860.1 x-prolyl-dipeptidyl aminopeptidase [Holzapfeliella floricola DSM 23037 = JCM 16512]
MNYNQYGRLHLPLEQQQKELEQLDFVSKNYNKLSFSNNIYTAFSNFFPEVTSNESLDYKFDLLAINNQKTLKQWLNKDNTALSNCEFYALALQLLNYEANQDFDLSDPFKLLKENQLPFIETDKIDDTNFIEALYLLLNTRAKNGYELIDNLADKGFFLKYIEDPHFNQHLFFNGKSLPVFDAQNMIREVVYVESDLDTDLDGQKDLLQVTIFRPKETDFGLKVPSLYTANPYFGGTNDDKNDLHNVDENLTKVTMENQPYFREATINTFEKTVLDASSTQHAEETATRQRIYRLNDYFFARGFANIYAGGFGTRGSDGLRNTGDPSETTCAKEVIEWLTGDRIAYTSPARTKTTAAFWSNSNIAMTGKSYLGTLATAVASTGVKGLKTIISEAAISSWYDYYRENGLVIAPDACQGEDCDSLAVVCQSNLKDSGHALKLQEQFKKQMAYLQEQQDRTTGQYSEFWDIRNYRHQLEKLNCSYIGVHGLNDWNVKPKNVYKLWQELEKLPIKHKLFLHQGEHVYMNNLASIDFTNMMNLWLSEELLNSQNNAAEQWPNVLIQDNIEADVWHAEKTWNNAIGAPHSQVLSELASEKVKIFTDNGQTFKQLGLSPRQWENAFIKGELSELASEQLKIRLSQNNTDSTLVGRPKINLSVASSMNKGQLSVMLVEYQKRHRLSIVPQIIEMNAQPLGYQFAYETLREFKPQTQTTDFKLIAKGHANLQNYQGKQAVDINPNEFYKLSFELQPTYYHLPKDSQLGLIIYSTDVGMTKRPLEQTTYTIDLTQSSFNYSIK